MQFGFPQCHKPLQAAVDPEPGSKAIPAPATIVCWPKDGFWGKLVPNSFPSRSIFWQNVDHLIARSLSCYFMLLLSVSDPSPPTYNNPPLLFWDAEAISSKAEPIQPYSAFEQLGCQWHPPGGGSWACQACKQGDAVVCRGHGWRQMFLDHWGWGVEAFNFLYQMSKQFLFN